MAAPVGALFVELRAGLARFAKDMQSATKPLRNFGKAAQRIGRDLSVKVSAPAGLAGAAILKTAGDFEAGMNRVRAVSGATGEQIAQLRQQAKDLGITTQFSASQAADAMGFLAQAGFEANEILGAMPDTLQLAAAAQLDLGTTADIVSNILTGYGLEVEQLGRANDVLVKTFTSTNTNLEQLGQAMKFVGPVASAAGVQFEETAAAIGLMGNAGIQAEMAGTALRGAISKILNPSKQAAATMENLGLQFTDSEGRLKSLTEIVAMLGPHAEDAGLFMHLFGQRAGPGMSALVQQGSAALAELTTQLENAGGTTAEIAAVQMQGFNGAMKALRSAVEGLMIAIGESGLLEAMTQFVNRIAEIIREVAAADPRLLKLAGAATAVAAAIGPVVVVLGTLATAMAALLSPIGLVIAAIVGAGGLVVAFTMFKEETLAIVQETIQGIKLWLVDKLQEVVAQAGEVIGQVTGFFGDMWREVVGESFVPDMIEGIRHWFGKLDQVMVKPAEQATKRTKAAFGRFAETAKDVKKPYQQINREVEKMTRLKHNLGRVGVDAFRGLALEGKSFGDVLKDIGSSLLRIAENMLFSGGGFGGGGFGFPGLGAGGFGGGSPFGGGLLGGAISVFSGFFQKGGFIPAGHFGIAGEMGPEPVFGPATVLPSAALARAGGVNANITIDARGADAGVFARLEQSKAQWQAETLQLMRQALDSGGDMARASGRRR